MTRPNRHDAPWSSSVERCLGLVHSAAPYFHPIGGRPPRSAAHLRQAHYLISRTACSKPTKRSSKRPARLGVASWPSPPPSPQSATAAGRTSVRNEGRWYERFHTSRETVGPGHEGCPGLPELRHRKANREVPAALAVGWIIMAIIDVFQANDVVLAEVAAA